MKLILHSELEMCDSERIITRISAVAVIADCVTIVFRVFVNDE